MDYLHERQHKRELRLESAQQGTGIAGTQQLDLERTIRPTETLDNRFW
jgi:cobalt-zinc-cadmium efflux system outer membrane protein